MQQNTNDSKMLNERQSQDGEIHKLLMKLLTIYKGKKTGLYICGSCGAFQLACH